MNDCAAYQIIAHQNLIHGMVPIKPDSGCTDAIARIALRVKIHQKNFLIHIGHPGTDVDAGSGLANTAFLVGNRNNLSHNTFPLFITWGTAR